MLTNNGFCNETRIDFEHMLFCRLRAEKAIICRNLAVTHFVDDRLEVLSYMESVPNRYLFQPDPAEVSRYRRSLPAVMQVSTWDALSSLLLTE